jgi:hypothetical protein
MSASGRCWPPARGSDRRYAPSATAGMRPSQTDAEGERPPFGGQSRPTPPARPVGVSAPARTSRRRGVRGTHAPCRKMGGEPPAVPQRGGRSGGAAAGGGRPAATTGNEKKRAGTARVPAQGAGRWESGPGSPLPCRKQEGEAGRGVAARTGVAPAVRPRLAPVAVMAGDGQGCQAVAGTGAEAEEQGVCLWCGRFSASRRAA